MAVRSSLLSYRTANAVLGWTTVGLLLVAAVDRWLAGEPLWAVMAVGTAALGIVPPAVSRRPSEMIAWEVLALAAIPVVTRSLGLLVDQLGYVSVAALALVVAVELDVFTAVEMTADFAVVFVVVVTMAVAGLWTIARYVIDRFLGTTLLVSQTAVMWDLVIATGVGVLAGLAFELYVRRLSPGRSLDLERWGRV